MVSAFEIEMNGSRKKQNKYFRKLMNLIQRWFAFGEKEAIIEF